MHRVYVLFETINANEAQLVHSLCYEYIVHMQCKYEYKYKCDLSLCSFNWLIKWLHNDCLCSSIICHHWFMLVAVKSYCENCVGFYLNMIFILSVSALLFQYCSICNCVCLIQFTQSPMNLNDLIIWWCSTTISIRICVSKCAFFGVVLVDVFAFSQHALCHCCYNWSFEFVSIYQISHRYCVNTF